jgi:hypothetical protein
MAESIASSQRTLPSNESLIPIQLPQQQQELRTRTDRLFDELRQILNEEPGIATSPYKSFIDHPTTEYIPQRGRTTARKSDYANMVGKKSGRALLREEGKWTYNCPE